MRADCPFVLEIHANAPAVVAIKRFKNDWIADLAGGSDGALLVLYSDRPRNRQTRAADQVIGQILVECDVGRKMALGRDVWCPNTPLVLSVPKLHTFEAVFKALHRDVATLSFRDQRARARSVTELCCKTQEFFHLSGE